MDPQRPKPGSERCYYITTELAIPQAELHFRTSRSSGPGGQHVNKTESKVELLFDLAQSPAVTEGQRLRLQEELRSWLDNDGVLHLVSEEYRSQYRNREAVVARFIDMLRYALRPRKVHKRTSVPRRVKEQRLQSKKHRGDTKRLRGSGRGHEE